MAVQTTVNFKWDFRKRKRPGRSSQDISIRRNKNGMRILFRNNTEEYFMPEGYVVFGFEGNLMGFMKSDSVRGYRIGKATKTATYGITVTDTDSITRLAPFLGEYKLECNEVNQLFIDRRHVK